jgi:hypothetical protein
MTSYPGRRTTQQVTCDGNQRYNYECSLGSVRNCKANNKFCCLLNELTQVVPEAQKLLNAECPNFRAVQDQDVCRVAFEVCSAEPTSAMCEDLVAKCQGMAR